MPACGGTLTIGTFDHPGVLPAYLQKHQLTVFAGACHETHRLAYHASLWSTVVRSPGPSKSVPLILSTINRFGTLAIIRSPIA